jgi:Caspase domain
VLQQGGFCVRKTHVDRENMTRNVVPLLLLVLLLGVVGGAAAEATPRSYALVVGANHGGHGQVALRYATDDARHFAALVRELGRTGDDQLELLIEPSVDAVREALAELRSRLVDDARAGLRSRVFFFYSGHAQARALSFGDGELPLEALRKELLALPSTLTVAVLDACQSGAFSGVKGAAPAADFSTSSVSNLNGEGIAVMASSTENELSQESSELGASYFTHHLLTALRGAADADRDGRVSLDEAYGYAYRNTLSDTLRTRVGSQHPTLEMDLKGHGAVALTYTADADARLLVPDRVVGRVVVQQRGRGAVLAELTKAQGSSAVTVALPRGDYEVLVTRAAGEAPRVCRVSLVQGAVYPLRTESCAQLAAPPALAQKGAGPPVERVFVELGIGRRFTQDDGFTGTLEAFRFRSVGDYTLAGDSGSLTPQLAAGVGLTPQIALLARLERLQKREFERVTENQASPDELSRFRWQTWSVAVGVRAYWPLLSARLLPFAEADLGLGLARSSYSGVRGEDTQSYAGPVLRADLGAIAQLHRTLGFVLSGGYDFAPVLKNELDQKRNDGGLHLSIALRLRFLRKGA